MEEQLKQVSTMINRSENIPSDIKSIVEAICRGYIRTSNGKISLESIKNVCNSLFIKIENNNENFQGEEKIFGTTDTMYDDACNVHHKISYVNDSNYIKLITILTHELGHVMTELPPCSVKNGAYSLVKRTTGFFTNCSYNEEGELLSSGIYGFRMSDGFLESICTKIFESFEFREELARVGYDLKDYVYKDERLFPSRIYDEYKACFELFDYIMDGKLFDFSCRGYDTNESLLADINSLKLNVIFSYLDKSNDALWKLKRFEEKENSEEFQSLLEDYKSKKSDVIDLIHVLLELYGKDMEEEELKRLLNAYESILTKQKLLPLSNTGYVPTSI